ncbi:MAG TPA: VPDSG-CTERM sorting domain-containing protein [Terriglobales bacterium]|nr:VPDSG-CTERM sorting domain-containing protein [Terriglobales bacterium]
MKVGRKTGKALTTAGTVAVLGLLVTTQRALALPIDLGTAGPGNWALLEISGLYGPAGYVAESDSENVSGAAAPPVGSITGNVGLANVSKMTTSAGNFPINGTVFVGDQSSVDSATVANASGNVVQNALSQALTRQAAIDARAASTAAAGLASFGGGVGVSSITAGGSLTPGVYNLTDFQLPNGAVLNLGSGGSYVFNISGTLKLDHAQVLTAAGLSESEVLFNVTGTHGVAFSGGLATESVLHGIILAPDASISLTPGLIVGEMISGEGINIASGGTIRGISTVPDAGSSLALMSIGLGFLATAKRKFLS